MKETFLERKNNVFHSLLESRTVLFLSISYKLAVGLEKSYFQQKKRVRCPPLHELEMAGYSSASHSITPFHVRSSSSQYHQKR